MFYSGAGVVNLIKSNKKFLLKKKKFPANIRCRHNISTYVVTILFSVREVTMLNLFLI